MSLTPEQLEQRLNYVCGSDCATIMGLNPWSNRVKLWQEKTRRIVAEDISHKACIKAGTFLEGGVRDWFRFETGFEVIEEPNLIVHPIHKWMAGNIDGWIILPNGEKALLEIKITGSDKGWGKHGENKIPYNYMCQISHYMAVTCVNTCYVVVLIGLFDLRTYKFERNIELEDIIIAKEQAFWELVTSDVPPTPHSSDEAISFHGYTSVPEAIIADESIEAHLESIEKFKESIRITEKKKEELETKIKLFMGKNENLLDYSGKIVATWKPTAPVKRFDAVSFKKDNEEEYYKYIKQTESSRRFSIKINNERT